MKKKTEAAITNALNRTLEKLGEPYIGYACVLVTLGEHPAQIRVLTGRLTPEQVRMLLDEAVEIVATPDWTEYTTPGRH